MVVDGSVDVHRLNSLQEEICQYILPRKPLIDVNELGALYELGHKIIIIYR